MLLDEIREAHRAYRRLIDGNHADDKDRAVATLYGLAVALAERVAGLEKRVAECEAAQGVESVDVVHADGHALRPGDPVLLVDQPGEVKKKGGKRG